MLGLDSSTFEEFNEEDRRLALSFLALEFRGSPISRYEFGALSLRFMVFVIFFCFFV